MQSELPKSCQCMYHNGTIVYMYVQNLQPFIFIAMLTFSISTCLGVKNDLKEVI